MVREPQEAGFKAVVTCIGGPPRDPVCWPCAHHHHLPGPGLGELSPWGHMAPSSQ